MWSYLLVSYFSSDQILFFLNVAGAVTKDHWGSIGVAEIRQYVCYCGVLIHSQCCFLPIASPCSLIDRRVTTPCSLVEMRVAVETAHNQSGAIGWSKRNPITSTGANGDLFLFFLRVRVFGMRGYSLSGCQARAAECVLLGCACYLEGRIFMRSKPVSNLRIRRSPLRLSGSGNSGHFQTQWADKQRGFESQEVGISEILYFL